MSKNTVCLVLLLVLALSASFAGAVVYSAYGSSWAEDIGDGRPDWVLHLNESSAYANGYAHGRILAAPAAANVRAYLNWGIYSKGRTLQEFLDIWNLASPFIAQEYKDELQGLADGSGISLDDLKAVHVLPNEYHCCGFAAKPPATTGGTVQGRSLDYPIDIQDPVTGSRVQDHGIIYLNRLTNEAHVTWAGFIGSVGGTRIGQVTVGEQGSGDHELYSWSDAGNPIVFQIRDAVKAANAQAAAQVLCSNRTHAFNFETSDSAGNVRAVEVAGLSNYYIGDWTGTEASPSHFWYIPDTGSVNYVVRRTNHFLALTPYQDYSGTDGSELHIWHFSENNLEPVANAGQLDAWTGCDVLRDTYIDFAEAVADAHSEHQWCINTNSGVLVMRRAAHDANSWHSNAYTYNLPALRDANLPSHFMQVTQAPWGTPTSFNYKGGWVSCHAGSQTCSWGHPLTYYWRAYRNGQITNDSNWVNRTLPDASWLAPRSSSWFDDRYYDLKCTVTCSGGVVYEGQFRITVHSITG